MQAVSDGLERHLREMWSEPALEIASIEPFGDGHSGFTYAVELSGRRSGAAYIVRLSPPNVRIAGPADVGRQGRIMAALHEAGLPVPNVLAHSSEPVVDGRAFVLMERVDGVTWAALAGTVSVQDALASAAEFVARMQALALGATGIADEEPKTLQAEIDRWSWLLDRSPPWLNERSSLLHDELQRSAPPDSAPALVHADFHFGNILFQGSSIVAVFDWEIAQLGEPLLDFGCLAVAAVRRRYEPVPGLAAVVAAPLDDVLEAFGIDAGRAAWHVALGCFKYAAILGYNYQLHVSGKRPDALYDRLGPTMSNLVDDGLAVLAGGVEAVTDDNVRA
jgi:aminoglycoside phosphotransferase (APT) family kinase protein